MMRYRLFARPVRLLITLGAALFSALMPLLMPTPQAGAGPPQPDYLPVIGRPGPLAAFWHDQRWAAGDAYACALYAQGSVLASLGYDFAAELDSMRQEGQRDGWYDPMQGAIGLGQPLRTRGLSFTVMGTNRDDYVNAERAVWRLMRELSAGRYAIANLDAQQLAHYRGSDVRWHTVWITGLRQDVQGRVLSVITNDSFHGPGVEYPIDQFLAAWGVQPFNFYTIFVDPQSAASPIRQGQTSP